MTPLPRDPVSGQGLSVSWGRELVRYLREQRIIQGSNVSVSRTPAGTVVSAAPTEKTVPSFNADETLPFQLRVHNGTDAAAEWRLEVWLPPGCLTTTGACVPLKMKPAGLAQGHGDDDAGWYLVPPMSGDYGPGSYTVFLYVMPGCHFLVRAEKRDDRGHLSDDDDVYRKCKLVVFRLADMTVRSIGGRLSPELGVQSNRGSKVVVTATDAVRQRQTNIIRYDLEQDADGVWDIKQIYIDNVAFFAGGLDVGGVPVEIRPSHKAAWLKLNHASSDYTAEIVLDTDRSERHPDTDDATYSRLYDLESGYAAADYRYAANTYLFLR